MTSVIPNLPANCEIVGAIHDNSEPDFLTQDMMEVFCTLSDTLIRVGWLPEEDPAGSYFVAVYRDCQRIQDVYRTQQMSEVKSVVERLACQFCKGLFSTTFVMGDSPRWSDGIHAAADVTTSRQLEFVDA